MMKRNESTNTNPWIFAFDTHAAYLEAYALMMQFGYTFTYNTEAEMIAIEADEIESDWALHRMQELAK